MSAADRPFINNATRREREEVLRNEQQLKRERAGDREPTTLHALSRLGQDEEGGRFAEARYVSGSEAATNMPRLPESSPWASDSVGVEPPTGEDITAMNPVGEFWEVERSIAEQELGEPAGASTHPACQNLELQSALEAGSPPDLEVDTGVPSTCPPKRPAGTGVLSTSIPSTELAGDSASLALAGTVGSAATSPPASVETSPANPPQPDDGLDVPRRSDGFPMSSHSVKSSTKMARRKL